MPERDPDNVLTLAEAASYLRVPEKELLRLAERGKVPAQRIGSEWRYLKRALEFWLTIGPRLFRDYPLWLPGHLALEEFLAAIEERLFQRICPKKPEPGSTEAVQKHVGVFKDEGDLDEVLDRLASIRAAKPGGGEG